MLAVLIPLHLLITPIPLLRFPAHIVINRSINNIYKLTFDVYTNPMAFSLPLLFPIINPTFIRSPSQLTFVLFRVLIPVVQLFSSHILIYVVISAIDTLQMTLRYFKKVSFLHVLIVTCASDQWMLLILQQQLANC